jgi:hypothetical protein
VGAPYNWYWANLGSQIHRIIAEEYRASGHFQAQIDAQLRTIVREHGGNLSALTAPENKPDIFDPATGALFEIKPEGDQSWQAWLKRRVTLVS